LYIVEIEGTLVEHKCKGKGKGASVLFLT